MIHQTAAAYGVAERAAAPLFPGQIVTVRQGAYAGQLGQVARVVHPGCILVKLTGSGAVLPFGPSELR